MRTTRRGVASAAETGAAEFPSVTGAVAGCAVVDVAADPAPSSLILVTMTHSLTAMETMKRESDSKTLYST